MSFKEIPIEIRYRSNDSNFTTDFLIPVLMETVLYKRAVGFFSTSALIDLSVGLFDLAKRGGKVQLVCSPELSEDDIEAIDMGYRKRDEVITNSLISAITNPVTEFEEERLNLIANMIANGTLDIKLAFMTEFTGSNLYHEKIAIFIDAEGNRVSHTGSMNESHGGMVDNFESIYTFCSFGDGSQQKAVYASEKDFDMLWANTTNKLEVIEFPQIVKEKLLKFKRDTVDFSTDQRQFNVAEYLKSKRQYSIPQGIKFRKYQDDAVKAWFEQGCRGVFSMCTGSGKTWTALRCMVNLAQIYNDHLATIILCPYIHLVSQWEEDAVNWGPDPIIAHSKSPQKDWAKALKRAFKRFRKEGKPFVCITVNDSFASEKVQALIRTISPDENFLIIGDEAHNLGSKRLSKLLPENIKNRIGLSATIERHMDHTGTKALFDYFGEEVINFELKDAIEQGALVHYDYHPIPVYLTAEELDRYQEITKQLRRYIVIENNVPKISESGKLLLFRRNRILAGAKNKVALLMDMIEPYKDDKYILVYCGAAMTSDDESDVEERQIDLITSKLRNELKMSVQRFTAEENLAERVNIKKYFATGQYQAITAIKCLDEGVNIPGIKTAFILSSSRNPKEFIQRRGRLLRKAEGKEKAVIYDFVTLPRPLDDVVRGDYESDKSIIIGELARISEFGELSDNYIEAELMKDKIMDAYDVQIDIEAELEKLEENYAE